MTSNYSHVPCVNDNVVRPPTQTLVSRSADDHVVVAREVAATCGAPLRECQQHTTCVDKAWDSEGRVSARSGASLRRGLASDSLCTSFKHWYQRHVGIGVTVWWWRRWQRPRRGRRLAHALGVD